MNLVIAGYADTREAAEKISDSLTSHGLEDCWIVPENGRFRVQAGAFRILENAKKYLISVQKYQPQAVLIGADK